jgi:hypothetical protein
MVFVTTLFLGEFSVCCKKNSEWQCHQDTKKVVTILMHHSKSQFWRKNKKNKKINSAQNPFFFAWFLSMSSSFCMKVTFSQVCKKSWLFASTLFSLEQKNETDFDQQEKNSKLLLGVVNTKLFYNLAENCIACSALF